MGSETTLKCLKDTKYICKLLIAVTSKGCVGKISRNAVPVRGDNFEIIFPKLHFTIHNAVLLK